MKTLACSATFLLRLGLALALTGAVGAARGDGPQRARPVPVPEETPATAYDEGAVPLLAETAGDPAAWRGWPLRVRLLGGNRTMPADLLVVSDAKAVERISLRARQPGVWWLSPAHTTGLAPGRYTLRVGEMSIGLEMADAPAVLSRSQQDDRQRTEIAFLLATGDGPAARRLAESWLAAADPHDPAPPAALGDALAAAGDDRGALTAYQTAIDRAGGGHPDLVLEQKRRSVLSRLFARLPVLPPGAATTPAASPTAPVSQRPVSPVPPAPVVSSSPPLSATSPGAPSGGVDRVHWATSARASSEYRTTDYSASRATGAPDCPRAGDHRNAWAAKTEDAGMEWIELEYAGPVRATGVRIVQNFNPGAVMKVEVIAAGGTATTVWTGLDATAYPAGQVGVLEIALSAALDVHRVRLTLDTARIRGWNEIDAVGLVGDAGR